MNRSCFALAALSFCLAACMLTVGNADDNVRSTSRRIIFGARYKVCWVPVDQCKRKTTDPQHQDVVSDENIKDPIIEQTSDSTTEESLYDQYVVDDGCYIYEDECGFAHDEEEVQISDEPVSSYDDFDHDYRSGYDDDYDREIYGNLECEDDLCGLEDVYDEDYDEYWYGGADEESVSTSQPSEENAVEVSETANEPADYEWYDEEYQPYDFDYEDYWHEPTYDSQVTTASTESIDLISLAQLSQRLIEGVDVASIQSNLHLWFSSTVEQVSVLISVEQETSPSDLGEQSEEEVVTVDAAIEDEESLDEWEDWYDEFDELDNVDTTIIDEPVIHDDVAVADTTDEIRIDRALIMFVANALDRSGASLQEASRRLIRLAEPVGAKVSSNQEEGGSNR